MLNDLGIEKGLKLKAMSKVPRKGAAHPWRGTPNAEVYLLDMNKALIQRLEGYILRTIITNCNPEAVVIISLT